MDSGTDALRAMRPTHIMSACLTWQHTLCAHKDARQQQTCPLQVEAQWLDSCGSKIRSPHGTLARKHGPKPVVPWINFDHPDLPSGFTEENYKFWRRKRSQPRLKGFRGVRVIRRALSRHSEHFAWTPVAWARKTR